MYVSLLGLIARRLTGKAAATFGREIETGGRAIA